MQTSRQTRTDVRDVVQRELLERQPMGGQGEIIQVDECLTRGKRNANRGRMLSGEDVPAKHQNNHGGVVEHGPLVFDLLWVRTGELRLFKVDQRDASTLGEKTAQNVLPGTTMHSDEWGAYHCIVLRLLDSQGSNMSLDWKFVNHSENFVDPTTGDHTQGIESSWQKAKRRLVRNGKKVPDELLESHLYWVWCLSLHGRWRCTDPFLSLIEAISRRYPM
ncbi:hypothetical protein HPB48_022379 [Haemaphysalis longicornis]|uniref:ISXO2-like transposase domain-containing protein n=1 Tax=Haemaphysalis longicornis TaxID=44386 RepID=A0A9J6F9Y2_HAELO|nr:hypothetical protein HPB48_022379 [Haemaphysalis longicornis]